jgi:hypothetical protein
MTIVRLLRIPHQRFRSLVRKDAVDAEVSRELAFHFDLLVAEHVTRGMALDDARRAARRALGNVAVLEEECRDHRRVRGRTISARTCRTGFAFAKSRAFTLVAAVSLALGLGANAATLGVLHSLKVRPLALPDADHLFVLRTFPLSNPGQVSGVPLHDYLAWRERSRSFVAFGLSLASATSAPGMANRRNESRVLVRRRGRRHWVRPARARLYRRRSRRHAWSVIVISHRLWTGRYHGDPAVVGRRFINRSLVTVIGDASDLALSATESTTGDRCGRSRQPPETRLVCIT